jgi:hypothetical protein
MQNKWYKKALINDDPIAQTFRVTPDMCADSDGLYITSVDLFFYSKDSVGGVTVTIREVSNGYPTRTVLPLSKVRLETGEVNTSTTGQTRTRVAFQGPVYLKTGTQYALAIKPDFGSPDYRVWYSQQGENEIVTGTPIGANWGDGVLFVSASDVWEPRLDADLKMRIYKAVYNTNTTGLVTTTNRDLEFFSLTSVSGTYTENEEVYKIPAAFIAGTATAVIGNSTITGSGTSFSSALAAGDSIVIRSAAATDTADVVKIKSVDSDTQLTVLGAPTVGMSDGKIAKTPTGRVSKYVSATGSVEMTLKDSTAASGSGNYFANTDVIKGCTSNANSTILAVQNKTVSYFNPMLYKTEPSGTTLTSSITQTSATNFATKETKQIMFGIKNKNARIEAAVHSKSNEIVNGAGAKSLVITSKLQTTNRSVSPVYDSDISALETFENTVNNLQTGEQEFGQGLAASKYLSKTVQLAPGLEAEDLNLYVTGYRPSNTSLVAYGMFTSADDEDKLVSKQWTKLEETPEQAEMYSSDTSGNDFKEFKYTVPNSPTLDSTTRKAGTANTTSGSLNIAVASASTHYSAGDLIVVSEGGLSDDYVLGRVASANSTIAVLNQAADKSISNGLHYKVAADEKQSVFKYPQSDGTYRLRYFSSGGQEHETFKYFQIKVLFLAEQTYKVPRVADIRAIALSA